VMIIGGATIYEQYLSKADRLYLTFIDLKTKGDTQFPDYQETGQWSEVEREVHLKDEKNAFDCQFVTLDRVEN